MNDGPVENALPGSEFQPVMPSTYGAGDENLMPYEADIDIVHHCRKRGLTVRTHPFFRDMEKCWPFVLCELKNATVLGEVFLPISDDELLSECVSWNGKKHLRILNQRDDNKERRLLRTQEAFLLGGDRAWGHFVVFNLMRVIYLQLFQDLKNVPVISMNGLQPSLYEILAIFGCPRDRLIELEENDALTCETLYAPTIAGGATFDGKAISVPDKLTRLYRAMILEAHGGSSNQAPTEAVYILRRKTKTKLILNDDEVARHMERKGYTVVDPSTLSLREQVELGQRAKFILSCWGSQMHIADFAQPGCKVTAMMCEDHLYQRSFDPGPNRFNALGLDFFFNVQPSDDEGNLTIDLPWLDKALSMTGFPV